MVGVPLRLNFSVALFATPPVPSSPVEPKFPTWIDPTEIVVPPLYVLAPVTVSICVPTFVRATVAEPFEMTPENVLGALLSTVKTGVPDELDVTLPAPDRFLTVWLYPFRSSVPVTVIVPLPIALLPPTFKVFPELMVVVPL